MRIAMLSISLAMIALSGPLLALVKAPVAQSGDPVLFISPGAADLILASGGRLLGAEFAPLAALAWGDDGFVERLSDTGAWIVTDGRWIAQICGVKR